MSASAEIFRFPGRTANSNSGFWSSQDIADVYRCLDQFARHGLAVEAASGLSDEGDPWFAIEDVASGDALVHIARINGFFVVHVLDGETWSGDTLRQALSNIDMASLAGLGATLHLEAGAAGDGDDDKDGTHAFLRIVSAVMAVLTTEVIASAVTQDAVASPLPPTGAPDAGDHGHDASNLALDLPAVESKIAKTGDGDAHDASAAATEKLVPVAQVVTVTKSEAAIVVTSSGDGTDTGAVEKAVPVAATAPANDIIVTASKQEIGVPPGQTKGVALSFAMGGEQVQVSYEGKMTFVGNDKKADTFLVVLDSNTTTLTAKVENFVEGQDSLVIERSDANSTSSAIVTDLGALVASNGSHLTVIGQATVEIHLTAASDSLVAGG